MSHVVFASWLPILLIQIDISKLGNSGSLLFLEFRTYSILYQTHHLSPLLEKSNPLLMLLVDVRRRSSKGCSERFTSGPDGDVPECKGNI
jgi:hypothetical protein